MLIHGPRPWAGRPDPATRAKLAVAVALTATLIGATVPVIPAVAQEDVAEEQPALMLETARALHTATTLADHSVLVFGGAGEDGEGLRSAELYEPTTMTFTTAGPLVSARTDHSATLLDDGQVLVIGGFRSPSLERIEWAELYDPIRRESSKAARSIVPRLWHTATLLDDGRVLVVGGSADDPKQSTTSEVYDPVARRFSEGGRLAQPRMWHTATRLADGRVLVVGGSPDLGSDAVAAVELYEPPCRACRRTEFRQ